MLLASVHRQNDHACHRRHGADTLGRLDAVESRHTDVHQEHIGTLLLRQRDGLTAVHGLADHLEAAEALQEAAHTGPEQIVIVGDEDAN